MREIDTRGLCCISSVVQCKQRIYSIHITRHEIISMAVFIACLTFNLLYTFRDSSLPCTHVTLYNVMFCDGNSDADCKCKCRVLHTYHHRLFDSSGKMCSNRNVFHQIILYRTHTSQQVVSSYIKHVTFHYFQFGPFRILKCLHLLFRISCHVGLKTRKRNKHHPLHTAILQL